MSKQSTEPKSKPDKANQALSKAWEAMQDRPLESAGRFDYEATIPPEIAREIFRILEPLEWILPPWCYCCFVFWNADANSKSAQDGASITASTNYEYRHIGLTFYPSFLDANVSKRRMMVIHDLLHSMISILADYAHDEIARLLPEEESPKYRAAVLEELTRRHEAMTQDFARMINERLA